MTLPLHVVELLEHVAHHPDGERPLFEAELECTAALYQVRPQRLEALRSLLDTAEARQEADAILSRAGSEPAVTPAAEPKPAQRDVDAVIAAALARPNGIEFLMRAPLDTAAVLLQAHPFVVEEARLRLASSDETTLNLTAAHAAPPTTGSDA